MRFKGASADSDLNFAWLLPPSKGHYLEIMYDEKSWCQISIELKHYYWDH